jgi:excisionase family DNA binding protein
MPVELLTAEQVAEQLKCKKTTVWIYAKQRKIDVIVMGTRRLFTQEAIDKFIREHTLPAKEK